MTENLAQNNVSCMNYSSGENTHENQVGSNTENTGLNGDVEANCENIQDREISCDNGVGVINLKSELVNTEDVFYQNFPSTGTAPTIPTSSQYGVVLVSNNELGENTTESDEKADDKNYSSTSDSVSCNTIKQVHTPPLANDRFKVVRIESNYPFRRGRWVCMDFLDKSASQHSQHNIQSIMNGEVQDNVTSSVGNMEALNCIKNENGNGSNGSVSQESFHSVVSNSQHNTIPINGIDRGLNNSPPDQSAESSVQNEVTNNASQCQAQSLTQASSVQYTSSNHYSQSQSLQPQQLQQLIGTNVQIPTTAHGTTGSQHALPGQQETVQQVPPHHLQSSQLITQTKQDQPQVVPLKQMATSEHLISQQQSVLMNMTSTFQPQTSVESSQIPAPQQSNISSQKMESSQQTSFQPGQSCSHSLKTSLLHQQSVEQQGMQNQVTVGSLQTPVQSHPQSSFQQVQQTSIHQPQTVFQQQPSAPLQQGHQSQVSQQSLQSQQPQVPLQQGQQSQISQQSLQSQPSHVQLQHGQQSQVTQQSLQSQQSQVQQQQSTQVQQSQAQQVPQQQLQSQQSLAQQQQSSTPVQQNQPSQVSQQQLQSQPSQIQHQHIQSQQSQIPQQRVSSQQSQISQQQMQALQQQQQVQTQHSQALKQPLQTHQPQVSQPTSFTQQQIQSQLQQNMQQTQPHLHQIQIQQPNMVTSQTQSSQLQQPQISQQQSQVHQQQSQPQMQQQRTEMQQQCQIQQQVPTQIPQQQQFHMQPQSQTLGHQIQSETQHCQLPHQSHTSASQNQIPTSLQGQLNLQPQINPAIHAHPQQQQSQVQQPSQVQQQQQAQVHVAMHQCPMKQDQNQMHQPSLQQHQPAMQSQPQLYNSQVSPSQIHQSQHGSQPDTQQITIQSSQSQPIQQQNLSSQVCPLHQQPQSFLPHQQNQHILQHQMSLQSSQQTNSMLHHQQSIDQQPLQMHMLHSQIQQPQTLPQHTFDSVSGQHSATGIPLDNQQLQPQTQPVTQSVPCLQQPLMSHQLNAQQISSQPQGLQQAQMPQYQVQPSMIQNAMQMNHLQNIPIPVQQSYQQPVNVHVPSVSQSSQNQYTMQQDTLQPTQFINSDNQQLTYNGGQTSYVNVSGGPNVMNSNTSAPASLQHPLNIAQQNFFNQTIGAQSVGQGMLSNMSIQPHHLTNQSQTMCDNQNQFSGSNVIQYAQSSVNQNIPPVSSHSTYIDGISESQQNTNNSQFVQSMPFITSNQLVSQQSHSIVPHSQPSSDTCMQTYPSVGLNNIISSAPVSQNPVSEYNVDVHTDAASAITHAQKYNHMYTNGSVAGSHQSYQSSIDSTVTTCEHVSVQSHFQPKTEEIPMEDNASRASDDAESGTGSNGNNAVAIDNKIEQAMDLVKSHLMVAVREEVEVLKEKIAELMDKISQLEMENCILKANATPETLAQLSSQLHHHNAAVAHASTSTTDGQQQPP